MTDSAPQQPRPSTAPPAAALVEPWQAILAGAIFVAASIIALRYHMLGRGASFWPAYATGAGLQLLFGWFAMWAAMGVLGLRMTRPWWSLLVLAAVFAADDAVHTFLFDRVFGRAVIMAIVHLLLISLLFRFKPAHAVFIGAITFLVKVVGSQMIAATWYTWF